MHAILLALALLAAPRAAPDGNPCTNGSFEELDPKGFPVDWQAVGQTVEATADAHSGKHALRMARTPEATTPETGLNRGWKPASGERGAMIDRLKGGIEFWYKAIAATGTRLTVFAIPMTADPVEKTGSARAEFTVPADHVGDGQWHHARLKYDFTDNPKVKWVHFSARILGNAGELILDDVTYVERVGPIVRFGKPRLEEDAQKPGRRCTLVADVVNAGDQAARDVRAKLTLPKDLKATPAELRLGDLAPGAKARAAWTIEGARTHACSFALEAASGPSKAHTSLAIAPRLIIENFGPDAPVAAVGRPFRLTCLVRNTGNAIVLKPVAEFDPLGGHRAATPTGELLPGQTAALAATLRHGSQTPSLMGCVVVRAANIEGKLTDTTRLVVAPAPRLPRHTARLKAIATDGYALLQNRHLRLAFPRTEFGFGPAELSVRTGLSSRTIAWLPALGRIAIGDGGLAAVAPAEPPVATTDKGEASLRFAWSFRDEADATWTASLVFALAADARTIHATYQLACDKARELRAFHGPMLHVLDRDEAVFPGLEWLVDDELSSSTLDIAEDHPHRKRFVVHPNMVTIPAIGIHGRHGTVGLLWDVHQRWDGSRDRPSVLFASPDRLHSQRSHVVGLFLPSVPEFVDPNETLASKPYPMKPGQPLRLQCRIFADGRAVDALAAMDEWLRLNPLPEPTPLPHGSYEREIQFSMRGYLDSLWDTETKQWWTSRGGHPLMSKLARPRAYAADLLLGAILSPDAAVREQCRTRAEEMAALLGAEPRLDALRFGSRADLAFANPAAAAGILASMGDDGAWRFDADPDRGGVFEGKDYHELGPDEAVELGTCAHNAFLVLRYARIAGDREAYARIEPTLRLMESFRVPRAAQVWEVPVHTPDVLAAADAIDAYIEAYRLSGDDRWLRDAVAWARRGLPFIYLWGQPDKPFLLGGSIPVFGATWFRGSWFGRPVQWNGLRYANALLKLVKHDQSGPWRRIAELIIHSAVHQQALEGDNAALWPDNINAIDSRKCRWVFAPRQILRNILKLTGRDEDPATVMLRRRPLFGREQRIHVTATPAIRDAAWKGPSLSFQAVYPKGGQGVVLVANVERPAAVLLDGKPIEERPVVEKGADPGWRHDPTYAYLAIRIARAGASAVRVEGVRHCRSARLPRLATAIDFAFDGTTDGWAPAHHIEGMHVRGGILVGRITGPDPYLVRSLLRVPASECPAIVLRLRVSEGGGGQLFWATIDSPGFAEEKSVRFPVQADGRFHDVRLDLSDHPRWRGRTITAIRIDPTGGAAAGEFALDHIGTDRP